MSKVIKLATRDKSYQAEVVECLKRLLAAAKQGEILSITYACERPGGNVTTGGTTIKDRLTLLGIFSHQAWLVNQALDNDAASDRLDGSDA